MATETKIDTFGVIRYFKDGKRHCEDGPAVITPDGDKYWYKNGQYHRVDGPAIERVSGYRAWYIEGKLKYEIEADYSDDYHDYTYNDVQDQ